MCRDTLGGEFASLFYGVFSPDGGQMTYCNAGHNPPLLLRGQDFRRLEIGGLVIGVSPDERFARDVVNLEPGDVLVFYTDGVTEALDFESQAFTESRLRESIIRYRDEEAATLARQLLWDVRRFVGLAPQADDMTVVVAKVAG
jgi:sigma-B regulation protein RsbU (phosphoserine phosphatase)